MIYDYQHSLERTLAAYDQALAEASDCQWQACLRAARPRFEGLVREFYDEVAGSYTPSTPCPRCAASEREAAVEGLAKRLLRRALQLRREVE